jgi:hypothetical protein
VERPIAGPTLEERAMKDRNEQSDSATRRALTERAVKSSAIESGAVRTRAVKSRTSRGTRRGQPPNNSIVTRSSAYMEPQVREAMISEAAYFRSAHRGFEPGHDVDDWLAAESEIDAALARGDLCQFCG